MDALWVALTLAAAVLGGWPLTSGILKLAKSKPRAVAEAPESNGNGTNPAEDAAQAAGNDPPDAAQAQAGNDPPDAAPAQPAAQTPMPEEILRGGTLIGVLERAAVVVAILAGEPVAIAYIVAIKGLGRYPELKSAPGASERFIIGTLSSMLWAASVAVLAKLFLHIG